VPLGLHTTGDRLDSLRATIGPGKRLNGADAFPADHIAADYFVDEDTAAMLE